MCLCVKCVSVCMHVRTYVCLSTCRSYWEWCIILPVRIDSVYVCMYVYMAYILGMYMSAHKGSIYLCVCILRCTYSCLYVSQLRLWFPIAHLHLHKLKQTKTYSLKCIICKAKTNQNILFSTYNSHKNASTLICTHLHKHKHTRCKCIIQCKYGIIMTWHTHMQTYMFAGCNMKVFIHTIYIRERVCTAAQNAYNYM
jgi:hypothetical protein